MVMGERLLQQAEVVVIGTVDMRRHSERRIWACMLPSGSPARWCGLYQGCIPSKHFFI